MTLILESKDWQKLWTNSVKTKGDGLEKSYLWQGDLGSITYSRLQLQRFSLDLVELEANRNIIIRSGPGTWGPSSSFFVKGISRCCHCGLTDLVTEAPGHHYLEYINAGTEEDYYYAKEVSSD